MIYIVLTILSTVAGVASVSTGWLMTQQQRLWDIKNERYNKALKSEVNFSGNWENVLVDPQMAPKDIRPMVMMGFNIIFDTQKYAGEYVCARINCTNCHFASGNTLGGINKGLSLVGVAQKFPIKRPDGTPYTLPDRINSCFQKSLNGKFVPYDSETMKAVLAYLSWISTGAQDIAAPAPWLGLKKLSSDYVPNVAKGKIGYATYCAMCHGANGEGQQRKEDLSYPALWGDYSYNDIAGLHQIDKFATFVYYNMPYGDPFLTLEEAYDIAAFVNNNPRPHIDKEILVPPL